MYTDVLNLRTPTVYDTINVTADISDSMTKIDNFAKNIVSICTGGTSADELKVVYLETNGKLFIADNDNPEMRYRVCGMSLEAMSIDAPVKIQHSGFIEKSGWGLTPGALYYLGNAGAIVDAMPATDFPIVVGIAHSSFLLRLILQPVKAHSTETINGVGFQMLGEDLYFHDGTEWRKVSTDPPIGEGMGE